MRTKFAAIAIGVALAVGFAIPGAWAKDAHSDAQFHCRAECNTEWSNCHTRCSRKPAEERDDCDDECTSDKSQCMTACDRM